MVAPTASRTGRPPGGGDRPRPDRARPSAPQPVDTAASTHVLPRILGVDLYQLKTFVAVAREGSITRAAEVVHLSIRS